MTVDTTPATTPAQTTHCRIAGRATVTLRATARRLAAPITIAFFVCTAVAGSAHPSWAAPLLPGVTIPAVTVPALPITIPTVPPVKLTVPAPLGGAQPVSGGVSVGGVTVTVPAIPGTIGSPATTASPGGPDVTVTPPAGSSPAGSPAPAAGTPPTASRNPTSGGSPSPNAPATPPAASPQPGAYSPGGPTDHLAPVQGSTPAATAPAAATNPLPLTSGTPRATKPAMAGWKVAATVILVSGLGVVVAELRRRRLRRAVSGPASQPELATSVVAPDTQPSTSTVDNNRFQALLSELAGRPD